MNGGSESLEDLIVNEVEIFSKNYPENDTELNENNNRDGMNASINRSSKSFTAGQIEDLVKQLGKEVNFTYIASTNTAGARYFVMYVWGVEGNSKILQSLFSQFDSSVDPNLKKEFVDDPPSAVCKHVSIGSNALEHAITVRSEKATRFVLESADKIGITLQISDKVIEQLLISFDDQECGRLIKMIIDYKIVIVYQDTEKGFFSGTRFC